MGWLVVSMEYALPGMERKPLCLHAYVFPPTHLVGPVLKHLQEYQAIATLVVPKLDPFHIGGRCYNGPLRRHFKLPPEETKLHFFGLQSGLL